MKRLERLFNISKELPRNKIVTHLIMTFIDAFSKLIYLIFGARCKLCQNFNPWCCSRKGVYPRHDYVNENDIVYNCHIISKMSHLGAQSIDGLQPSFGSDATCQKFQLVVYLFVHFLFVYKCKKQYYHKNLENVKLQHIAF